MNKAALRKLYQALRDAGLYRLVNTGLCNLYSLHIVFGKGTAVFGHLIAELAIDLYY